MFYNGARTREEHDANVIATAVNYRATRYMTDGRVDQFEDASLRVVLKAACLSIKEDQARIIVYAINADGHEALIPQKDWLNVLIKSECGG